MLYSHIEEEIYNSSLELIKLHEKHPILHTVTNFSDFKNLQSQLPQEQPAQVLPALETKTTCPTAEITQQPIVGIFLFLIGRSKPD
jgi:hypothetical protein